MTRSKGYYKIENDIPIPKWDPANSSRTKALLQLQVGQSILCPELQSVQSVGRIRDTMKKLSCDFKFVARAVEGGIRIWRVE